MRILHILDHSVPLLSGYTFRTLAILQQQRALGWTTIHLTGAKQGHSNGAEQYVDGWHFYRTRRNRARWARLPLLRHYSVVEGLTKRLQEVARVVRPDILHAHSPALNALAALKVGRRLGIPVVYEVRAFWEDAAADHGTSRAGGLRYRLTRALETYALRRANAITTICEGLRRELCGRGISEQKITVIPNAADPGRFARLRPAPAHLAQKFKPDGGPLLGFIGSFYAYEGLDLLLHALPQMLAEFPALRVLLVGGGPQEDRLKALSGRLGLAGRVFFAGPVPHDQIDQYYQLLDVLAYPRLPMRLTDLVTPLKPLEAMALGKLVVASDVGGQRELITHGKNGLLFQAGNVQALADTVASLLRHPESWPALRLAARQFVEHERNWSNSVGRYAAVYQRLIEAEAWP